MYVTGKTVIIDSVFCALKYFIGIFDICVYDSELAKKSGY